MSIGLYKWQKKLRYLVSIVYGIIFAVTLVLALVIDSLMALFFGIVTVTFGFSTLIVTIFVMIYNKKYA